MDRHGIILNGLENLRKDVGIRGEYPSASAGDDVLQLHFEGVNLRFVPEIVNEVRAGMMPHLEKLRELTPELIVVAARIYPKVRREMRNIGMSYLEANGNFFHNKEGLLILIDGNRPFQPERQMGNRAFGRTGLKVLFQFLMDGGLVDRPQREIAAKADVALGNIPLIIVGLRETGHLVPLDSQRFVWADREGLLAKWVSEYQVQLRPSLVKGRFSLRSDWREVVLDANDSCWGGEPGAEILTGHLRPGALTVYTRLNVQQVVRKYGLLPDPDGDVTVITKFWGTTETTKGTPPTVAPPVLVYADLLITGDKRCRETAAIIFEKYVRSVL